MRICAPDGLTGPASLGPPQAPQPGRHPQDARGELYVPRLSARRGVALAPVECERHGPGGMSPPRAGDSRLETIRKAVVGRRLPRPAQAARRTGQAGQAPERADDGRAANDGARQDHGPRYRRPLRRRVGRSRAAERSSLGVVEPAHRDERQVDQVPDAAAPEGDELEDAQRGVAQVEPVDAGTSPLQRRTRCSRVASQSLSEKTPGSSEARDHAPEPSARLTIVFKIPTPWPAPALARSWQPIRAFLGCFFLIRDQERIGRGHAQSPSDTAPVVGEFARAYPVVVAAERGRRGWRRGAEASR